jgi:hypothetical protein
VYNTPDTRIKFEYVDEVRYPQSRFDNGEIMVVPLSMFPGNMYQINISMAEIPMVHAGRTIWDIATFAVPDPSTALLPTNSESMKRDEFLQKHGFESLPYIEILPSSILQPAYYGERNAKIEMVIHSTGAIFKDYYMMVSRPDGYRFRAGTFIPKSDSLKFPPEEDGTYEHGVDTINQPVDEEFPLKYYFKIVKYV